MTCRGYDAVLIPEVSADDILALVRKYEEVVRLRREGEPGSKAESDPRPALAALAAEFPGALRELDQLPLADLESRIQALRRVVRGEEAPGPWMAVQARFHPLMRSALHAKRWLRGRRQVDVAVVESFRRELPSQAAIWAKDLARIAAPPRGRVVELVLLRVAEELDVDVLYARRLMFGSEREGRSH